MTFTNWTLAISTEDDRKYMLPLFEFLLLKFVEIFGETALGSEKCIVYNDPAAPCPMLVTNTVPIKIRTSVSSLGIWNQYIYHLSHEMTHYVIRQYKPDKNVTIKWFEETLCEAMSLYILKWSGEHWNQCTLSSLNPNYDSAILTYYKNAYHKVGDSVLQQCRFLSDLQAIENTCEENRIGRSIERNYLVDTFCEYPDYIASFVYYTLYMRGAFQIDFTKWKANDTSPLIPKLETIQPLLVS